MQANMGVQSSLTWSWSSESFDEKLLPVLQTYTKVHKVSFSRKPASDTPLTLIEDSQKSIDISLQIGWQVREIDLRTCSCGCAG